jgi:aromatic-amino-acid transaminase
MTFAALPLAPRDPILGMTETFNADPRTDKINLGVGVYYTDEGKLPLLKAVEKAEEARVAKHPARGYLPIDGIALYNKAVQGLLLGDDSALIAAGRIATVQAIGGTGALKVGADLLKRFYPDSHVWISDPSWENHRALFESAGFTVNNYAYYDAVTRGVDFPAMLATLQALPANAIVVLHACCHNPTGVDLDKGQWQQVVNVVKSRHLIPFLDMAYQGFAEGTQADAFALRLFANEGISLLVSSSFSKSFSMYGERIGALSVVCKDKDETTRVLSQLKRVVRTNYSNPPTHGAAIVEAILASAELRALWEEELGQMRERIRAMRLGLVTRLKELGVKQDFDFVVQQRGMFSYSGLTSAQVDRLRDEFGVYAINTGRICLAALNSKNLDTVAKAIAKVVL